jgi:hypothetical protein
MVAVVALMALLVGFDHRRRGHSLNTRPAVSEFLTLTDDDDGKLFSVRVLNTGEMRVARCHRFAISERALKSPCFADPQRPDDYRRWLHEGWGARAVSPVRKE